MVFDPRDVTQNMERYGGYLPGIPPGLGTEAYMKAVCAHLNFMAAVFLASISMFLEFLIVYLNVPFYFASASLIIVVGVALATIEEVECYGLMRRIRGHLR
jgi:preprotein translocase subunit SecY